MMMNRRTEEDGCGVWERSAVVCSAEM